MPGAILHLVSDQTLQNLIPILAVRPATIVQVRSADERFAVSAGNLKKAVACLQATDRFRDYRPEFFDVIIPEESPSMDATRRKVGEALSLWPASFVNLTGGTKLMSIGAWMAAQYERRPVLYCDTQRREFVVEGSRQPPNLPAFSEAASSLTIDAVLAAVAGLDASNARAETTSAEEAAFAREVGRVSTPWSFWISSVTRRFYREGTGKLVTKNQIREELALPLGAVPPELVPAVGAATRAGALYDLFGEPCLAPKPSPFPGNADQLFRTAEDNLRLLQGGWFEIGVEQALKDSKRFTEVRRGLAPDAEAALGETDFVAFDPQSVRLVAVSCKASDGHLHVLEHLCELQERTLRLGGTFAKAALVLGRSDHPGKLKQLATFARALKISVYVGNPAAGTPQIADPALPDHLYWKSSTAAS